VSLRRQCSGFFAPKNRGRSLFGIKAPPVFAVMAPLCDANFTPMSGATTSSRFEPNYFAIRNNALHLALFFFPHAMFKIRLIDAHMT
jgi:hypothetical protein